MAVQPARNSNREDVQRAATPPPDPVAPTTLPSAQLLDVQGKSIAPLQQGVGRMSLDLAQFAQCLLCPALAVHKKEAADAL